MQPNTSLGCYRRLSTSNLRRDSTSSNFELVENRTTTLEATTNYSNMHCDLPSGGQWKADDIQYWRLFGNNCPRDTTQKKTPIGGFRKKGCFPVCSSWNNDLDNCYAGWCDVVNHTQGHSSQIICKDKVSLCLEWYGKRNGAYKEWWYANCIDFGCGVVRSQAWYWFAQNH